MITHQIIVRGHVPCIITFMFMNMMINNNIDQLKPVM